MAWAQAAHYESTKKKIFFYDIKNKCSLIVILLSIDPVLRSINYVEGLHVIAPYLVFIWIPLNYVEGTDGQESEEGWVFAS